MMTVNEEIMSVKDYIEIALTSIIVIATIIYVWFTAKLVKESRMSREFHLEAHLICYLVTAENNPSYVTMIIENVGNGVAKNIQGNVLRDISFAVRPLREIGLFSKKLEYFPPGYKQRFFLGTLAVDYANRIKDYFEFELVYDDQLKKAKKQFFKLEFIDVKGFSTVTPPDTHIGMIAYRLEKIEKILEKK